MRAHLTSALDLVGVLLVVLGLVLFVATWSVPAALACGGVLLLVASWIVDGAPRRRNGGRR